MTPPTIVLVFDELLFTGEEVGTGIADVSVVTTIVDPYKVCILLVVVQCVDKLGVVGGIAEVDGGVGVLLVVVEGVDKLGVVGGVAEVDGGVDVLLIVGVDDWGVIVGVAEVDGGVDVVLVNVTDDVNSNVIVGIAGPGPSIGGVYNGLDMMARRTGY